MQTIDNTELHNTIVQKAFEAAHYVLTDEQKAKLFRNKIDRAQAELEARKDCPIATRSGLYSKWSR